LLQSFRVPILLWRKLVAGTEILCTNQQWDDFSQDSGGLAGFC